MTKTLCELDDLLKRDPERYLKKVLPARHYCEKCGRVAKSAKRLCKPRSFDELKDD